MDFLRLTDATAPTARSSLPAWPALPTAALSPGALADALHEAQGLLFERVGATSAATRGHTADVADFADTARRLDADLSKRLGGAP